MAKRQQRKHSRGDLRSEGTRVLTPTLERHQIYRRSRDDYQVWHGPLLDVDSYGAALDAVVADYERREVEEDRTIEALRTGDPLATCRVAQFWTTALSRVVSDPSRTLARPRASPLPPQPLAASVPRLEEH